MTRTDLVRTLRQLSARTDKTDTVLIPDEIEGEERPIKSGYHNVADLLYYLGDMLE